MSDQPVIAVFAPNAGESAYLSAIVQVAGYRPVPQGAAGAEKPVLVLASGEGHGSMDGGQSVLQIGGAAPAGEEADVRVLDGPIRAGVLINLLRKAVTSRTSLPIRIGIGDAQLDTRDNLWILGDAEPVRLTEKETAILSYLKLAGVAVTRDELLEHVWAYAQGVETHTLETHIYRLRQKIEKDPSAPQILITDEDGYRLKE